MMPQYEKKLIDKEMKEQFNKTLKSIKQSAPKPKKAKKAKRRSSYAQNLFEYANSKEYLKPKQ